MSDAASGICVQAQASCYTLCCVLTRQLSMIMPGVPVMVLNGQTIGMSPLNLLFGIAFACSHKQQL